MASIVKIKLYLHVLQVLRLAFVKDLSFRILLKVVIAFLPGLRIYLERQIKWQTVESKDKGSLCSVNQTFLQAIVHDMVVNNFMS